MAAASQTASPAPRVDFETSPDRYRHWKLAFAGSTTTGFRLVLDPATFPESPAPRAGAPPDRDTGPEP